MKCRLITTLLLMTAFTTVSGCNQTFKAVGTDKKYQKRIVKIEQNEGVRYSFTVLVDNEIILSVQEFNPYKEKSCSKIDGSAWNGWSCNFTVEKDAEIFLVQYEQQKYGFFYTVFIDGTPITTIKAF